MGAILVLSVRSNNLRADGGKVLAEGLKGNTVITELDISSNALGVDSFYEPDMSGIIALVNAIPYMGALTSLDLSSNWLRAAGAKIVAEAIKVTLCTPAIILVPFSCPSDFSINCCCLLLSEGYGGPIGVVLEEQHARHQRSWEGFGPSFGQQFYPQRA